MKSPITKVNTPTGHWYQNTVTGEQVPGVTRILNSLPKGALETWRLKKAVSLALKGGDHETDGEPLVDWLIGAGDREANQAAAIGTKAHAFAESYLLGENPDLQALNKPERKHAECFLHFVRDYQPESLLVEKVFTYIDPKSGNPLYCGSADLIATLTWNDASDASYLPNDWVDGLTWLCDWKASSSAPRSSHALQTAAYRYSTHWLDEESGELHEMPTVDKTAVILLNGGSGERCYRMYELDSSPVVFSVFKSLLKIHNFCKIESRVILSEM